MTYRHKIPLMFDDADEVIDYNAQDFVRVVSNCDAVFDMVGGEAVQKSFAVLRPGGRAAFIASGPQAPKPDRDDVTALRPSAAPARRSNVSSSWSGRAPCARPRSRSTACRKPPRRIASASHAISAASWSSRCADVVRSLLVAYVAAHGQ